MTSDLLKPTKTLYVWIFLPGATDPVVAGRVDLVGHLHQFTYGKSYLRNPDAIPIFLPELTLGGCGQKLGLFLRHKAEAFTVLDWASATKGHLDARFVIPADVGVNLVNELGHGEGPPIAGIEELSLQTSKEAFTCSIVLRTRLS